MTELSVGTGGGLATNSICWCEYCAAAGGGGVLGGVAHDVKIELLLLVRILHSNAQKQYVVVNSNNNNKHPEASKLTRNGNQNIFV